MNYSEIAAVIGADAAALLIERLGGIPIYIPAYPSSGSPLVLAIGHAAAARLCDAYAGQTFDLPSRSAIAAKTRRRHILYDLARGIPVAEIALRHGLTASHVYAIRRKGAAKSIGRLVE